MPDKKYSFFKDLDLVASDPGTLRRKRPLNNRTAGEPIKLKLHVSLEMGIRPVNDSSRGAPATSISATSKKSILSCTFESGDG
jgi:hypothetical protein